MPAIRVGLHCVDVLHSVAGRNSVEATMLHHWPAHGEVLSRETGLRGFADARILARIFVAGIRSW